MTIDLLQAALQTGTINAVQAAGCRIGIHDITSPLGKPVLGPGSDRQLKLHTMFCYLQIIEPSGCRRLTDSFYMSMSYENLVLIQRECFALLMVKQNV